MFEAFRSFENYFNMVYFFDFQFWTQILEAKCDISGIEIMIKN